MMQDSIWRLLQKRFNHDLRKHGSYCGYTDFEEWLNSLTNAELVQILSDVIEEANDV